MSKKILVIDDNQDILDLLRDLLTAQGYEVICLICTDNVLNDIATIGPDLIILDYLLAGINGGELCWEIKNQPATKHLPVLILSAYSRVLDSLGHYGQDAFIAKPFDIADLLQTIARCFSGDTSSEKQIASMTS